MTFSQNLFRSFLRSPSHERLFSEKPSMCKLYFANYRQICATKCLLVPIFLTPLAVTRRCACKSFAKIFSLSYEPLVLINFYSSKVLRENNPLYFCICNVELLESKNRYTEICRNCSLVWNLKSKNHFFNKHPEFEIPFT